MGVNFRLGDGLAFVGCCRVFCEETYEKLNQGEALSLKALERCIYSLFKYGHGMKTLLFETK